METGLIVKPPPIIVQAPAAHSLTALAGVLLIISSSTGAFLMIIPYAFFILGALLGTAALLIGLTMTCITNRLLAKLLALTHT